MNYKEYLTTSTYLLSQKLINEENHSFLNSVIEHLYKNVSGAINYNKCLRQIKENIVQGASDLTEIEAEQLLSLVFAQAKMLNELHKPNNSNQQNIALKSVLLSDLISGRFRSQPSALLAILNESGINLAQEHIVLIKAHLLKCIDDIYLAGLSRENEAIQLGNIVTAITKEQIRKWQCAVNISRIFEPRPEIKSPRRATLRWFFDSCMGSIRNGCTVAVTLAISAALYTTAVAASASLLPMMLIAAAAIGLLTTIIGITYGIYRSIKKGRAQRTVATQTAQMLQRIAQHQNNPEKKSDHADQLARYLHRYDLQNGLANLKRRQFIFTTTTGDTSERMMNAITPLMRTGMRPDVITSAIFSGAELAAPKFLRRYWYEDERWNFYVDYLISLSKAQDKALQYQIMREISMISNTVNFNRFCKLLDREMFTEQELLLIGSLNILTEKQDRKRMVFVVADKINRIEAKSILKIRQFLKKSGFPEHLIQTIEPTSVIKSSTVAAPTDADKRRFADGTAAVASIWAPFMNFLRRSSDDSKAQEADERNETILVVPGIGLASFDSAIGQKARAARVKR